MTQPSLTLHPLPFLPFQDTLSDGGDGGVVTFLDTEEEGGEGVVVGVDGRGVFECWRGGGEVSAKQVIWRWREGSTEEEEEETKR